MINDGDLEAKLQERYQDWSKPEASKMLGSSLEEITQLVLEKNINPEPRSGNQEILENYVNRFVQFNLMPRAKDYSLYLTSVFHDLHFSSSSGSSLLSVKKQSIIDNVAILTGAFRKNFV